MSRWNAFWQRFIFRVELCNLFGLGLLLSRGRIHIHTDDLIWGTPIISVRLYLFCLLVTVEAPRRLPQQVPVLTYGGVRHCSCGRMLYGPADRCQCDWAAQYLSHKPTTEADTYCGCGRPRDSKEALCAYCKERGERRISTTTVLPPHVCMCGFVQQDGQKCPVCERIFK